MKDKHTTLPLSKCPTCGHGMDCATSVENKNYKPKPGDATLCIKCGAILTFDEGLILVFPTRERQMKFEADPRVITAQIVIRGRPDRLK